jgi:hypothetical protein
LKNDLGEDDDSKKKKKRSQKKSVLNNLVSDEGYMGMSEGAMGGGKMVSECPLLDSIEKKCRGIDIMSGDSHQNLLDACGEHQLCYLCVSVIIDSGQLGQNNLIIVCNFLRATHSCSAITII